MRIIFVLLLISGLFCPGVVDAKAHRFSSPLPFQEQDTIPATTLVHKADSANKRLTHQIDSLKKLHLSTAMEKHLIDSLQKASPLSDISKAEKSVMSVEQQAGQAANKLNREILNTEKQLGVPPTGLPKEVSSTIATPNLSVPGVPASGSSIPGNPTSELNTITNAPQKEITTLQKEAGLGNVQKDLTQVNGYSKDVQQISKGNLDSTQVLKTAENKAMQMGSKELKQLPGQSGQLAEATKLGEKMNDPEAAQKLAMEEAKKMATDHFAGKEKELQAAMQQVSKLKSKYPSLSSMDDIKKMSRNQMHGKPFVERFVPGINFQPQVNRRFTLDLNPQAGYRWTRKLTVGAGWNERASFHHEHISFHRGRVYGPRFFTEFQIRESFAVRGEFEMMNAYVPSLFGLANTPGQRQWVPGVFLGLKKSYTLARFLKGNIQTLYNFTDRYSRTSPYADRLNVRIGFDFPIKKKIPLPNIADINMKYMKAAENFLKPGLARKAQQLVVLSHQFEKDTATITRGITRRWKPNRMAITTYGTYRFRYSNKIHRTEILNSGDSVVATTRHFYDLTMPDGKLYKFKRMGAKGWKYVSSGKDIVVGNLIGNEPNTAVVITWIDPAEQDNKILKMMCQVYGTRLIETRTRRVKYLQD